MLTFLNTACAWPLKSFHKTLSYDNKRKEWAREMEAEGEARWKPMKGNVSVNTNCGCERWLRWPCDPWPPSPRSIQSSTMVDTCVLSILALLLFTSVSGRGRERPQEARGAVKQSAPASCQQHPLSPKGRCLPIALSLSLCLAISSSLIISDNSKHIGGRRGSTKRTDRVFLHPVPNGPISLPLYHH